MPIDGMSAYKKNLGNKKFEDNFDKIDWSNKGTKKGRNWQRDKKQTNRKERRGKKSTDQKIRDAILKMG